MSLELDSQKTFLETLSREQKFFLHSFLRLTKKDLVIDWDIDQTLSLTEDPVKSAVDARFGTNYLPRRTDGWNSISGWLVEDHIMDQKAAWDYEAGLWVNQDILMSSKPNEALRKFSLEAYKRKIPQYVTTVRAPGLRQITYRWLDYYFPWIPAGRVNFRVGMNVKNLDFKMGAILDLYNKNPGLVHIDDDLNILRPLAEKSENLGIIGITYASDDVSDLKNSGNRIFLDRDILSGLVAQSS